MQDNSIELHVFNVVMYNLYVCNCIGPNLSLLPATGTYNFNINDGSTAEAQFENQGSGSYRVVLKSTESDNTTTTLDVRVTPMGTQTRATISAASNNIRFAKHNDITSLLVDGEEILSLNNAESVNIPSIKSLEYKDNKISLDGVSLVKNISMLYYHDGFRFYKFEGSIVNPLSGPGTLYYDRINNRALYSILPDLNTQLDREIQLLQNRGATDVNPENPGGLISTTLSLPDVPTTAPPPPSPTDLTATIRITTNAPVTPASTNAPVTPASTNAPVTPASTNAPVTPASTDEPDTEEPETEEPETEEPDVDCNTDSSRTSKKTHSHSRKSHSHSHPHSHSKSRSMSDDSVEMDDKCESATKKKHTSKTTSRKSPKKKGKSPRMRGMTRGSKRATPSTPEMSPRGSQTRSMPERSPHEHSHRHRGRHSMHRGGVRSRKSSRRN